MRPAKSFGVIKFSVGSGDADYKDQCDVENQNKGIHSQKSPVSPFLLVSSIESMLVIEQFPIITLTIFRFKRGWAWNNSISFSWSHISNVRRGVFPVFRGLERKMWCIYLALGLSKKDQSLTNKRLSIDPNITLRARLVWIKNWTALYLKRC